MLRVVRLYQSSVGKKIAMATTGTILVLFVIGHLVGNFKIFFGEVSFNKYAHWLREVGYPLFPEEFLLWVARIVLLACVGVHMLAALQLTLQSWGAREVQYQRRESIALSYASYTMRWGGVLIAVYVLYHLLHLTWGAPVAGVEFDHTNPYENVVRGFQVWWVSLIYVAAQIPLGAHLFHGVWSGLQTLGINNPQAADWRRPFAATIAIAVVLGYVSIPVSVMLGWVTLAEEAGKAVTG